MNWIAVKTGLPAGRLKGKRLLTWSEGQGVQIAMFRGDRWFNSGGYLMGPTEVTHWCADVPPAVEQEALER